MQRLLGGDSLIVEAGESVHITDPQDVSAT